VRKLTGWETFLTTKATKKTTKITNILRDARLFHLPLYLLCVFCGLLTHRQLPGRTFPRHAQKKILAECRFRPSPFD
jgi:hypothetical protein